MGGAVLADGDAGVRGADLDVQVRVGHRHADLVIDASGNETGERAGERHLAAQRQTGGDADHVGLRDAALDETLRIGRLEVAHLHASRDVSRQCENILVMLRGFHQAGAEPGTGVFLCIILYILHAKNFRQKYEI